MKQELKSTNFAIVLSDNFGNGMQGNGLTGNGIGGNGLSCKEILDDIIASEIEDIKSEA